jgi:Methyltransferase domain
MLVEALRYYATRPLELRDRLAGELQRRRENQPRIAVDDLESSSPIDAVHQLLGQPVDCPECARFRSVWAEHIADPGRGGYHYHDAGLGTVQGMWAVVRHLKPEAVVETGVARGLTSAGTLLALRENGSGHLYSIDLPEVRMLREGTFASAVSEDLKGRWTLVVGSARRRLPRLLEDISPIDVFLHDSLHTRKNMAFEIEAAWAALRPGGVLFVDDADDNSAFIDFAELVAAPFVLRGRVDQPGAFGMIRKP